MGRTSALAHRVLLIEGEHGLARGYRRSLTSAGFAVTAARGGPAALRSVAAEPFDAVIAEASVPGTDGIDLVRQLRRCLESTPILLLLAELDNELALRGVEAGARQCLVRPDAVTLSRAVAQVLSPARPAPGVPFAHLSVTSTKAQNNFREVLDAVIEGQRVVITRYDAPKAVMLPFAEFRALLGRGARQLEELSSQFDALLSRLQTPAARAGLKAAFGASPKKLAKVAVAAAPRRG